MTLNREAYYRCIWTVRDYERIRRLARMAVPDREEPGAGPYMEEPGAGLYREEPGAEAENMAAENESAENEETEIEGEESLCTTLVSDMAIERAVFELDAIVSSMEAVPENYRGGVFRNIALKEPFDDIAHPNTWKKWKNAYINELARRLYLV